MAADGFSPIAQAVLDRTWACLEASYYKNGTYDQIFPTKDDLASYFTASKVQFCDSLLDAITAPFPPPVSFFESLPFAKVRATWGVYALVLKCPTLLRPLVYIGTGTGTERGIIVRMRQYDRSDVGAMPRFVLDAMRNGYKIVYKGLLAWGPIPPAAKMIRMRLVYLAIEATFSFFFWAIKSKDKDYGMRSVCGWPQGAFVYGGLCSHNCLKELPRGDYNLTAEQLEAVAAASQERLRVARRGYKARNKEKTLADNRRWYRIEAARNPDRFRNKAIAQYHTTKHEIGDRRLAERERYEAKKIDSKQYHCSHCNRTYVKLRDYNNHMVSQIHDKTMRLLKAGIERRFICSACKIPFESQVRLDRHRRGPRHVKKVAKLARARAAVVGVVASSDAVVAE